MLGQTSTSSIQTNPTTTAHSYRPHTRGSQESGERPKGSDYFTSLTARQVTENKTPDPIKENNTTTTIIQNINTPGTSQIIAPQDSSIKPSRPVTAGLTNTFTSNKKGGSDTSRRLEKKPTVSQIIRPATATTRPNPEPITKIDTLIPGPKEGVSEKEKFYFLNPYSIKHEKLLEVSKLIDTSRKLVKEAKEQEETLRLKEKLS